MHEIKILLFIIRSIRISFKKFNSSNFFKRKIDENNLIVSKKMFTDTKFRYRVNLSLSRLLQHVCVSRREKKKLAQASIDGASTEITLNLTRSLRVKKKKKKKKMEVPGCNSSINIFLIRRIFTFRKSNFKNIGENFEPAIIETNKSKELRFECSVDKQISITTR